MEETINIKTMKKIVIITLCFSLFCVPVQAQLGGLLQNAAKKTTEKVTEKLADQAAEAASKALEEKMNQNQPQKPTDSRQSTASTADQLTYAGLMGQVPELPTVQQLVSHKEYELNGQTLRLLSSPVTKFSAQVTSLSMKVLSVPMEGADSAQVVENAYSLAQKYTGLTQEQIDYLATLPEDEQEAYLAAHYQQGQAEAALMEQAVEAGEYLEPLQPMIDKWEAAGKKADQYLSEADAQCKEIYKKYGPQKSGASEKEQIQLTLKYYQEIAPIQRTAVEKAMKVRLEEQLPIAEEIEKEMVAIRAAHPNMISSLLRYPQLTATSFFSDITRLTDVPEY